MAMLRNIQAISQARSEPEIIVNRNEREDMQTSITKTIVRRPAVMGRILLALTVAFAMFLADPAPAKAEYGDVVINNYSDGAGMRPVVFPHWFHRIRFRCKVCHADLGFKFKAGGNDINMYKIIEGKYCGACHNGKVAWSVKNCILCHSGKPGTPIQIHESTMQELAVPTNPLTSKK
jgi:c(7)-type cytochrome triheme protein